VSKKRHEPADTELARGFTIRDYETARESQPPGQDAIAEAIHRRFTDRYIAPVSTSPKHGFTIMAVSCLMIEALESFRQGWEDTDRKSRAAFASFFNTFEPFHAFRNHADAFYTHVRCGILHQAETTGGWRIRRDNSPLLDPSARTINAERFLMGLTKVLLAFCEQLKDSDWNGSEWGNVRKKMDAIARNCR
jgi:hypothetical protein